MHSTGASASVLASACCLVFLGKHPGLLCDVAFFVSYTATVTLLATACKACML